MSITYTGVLEVSEDSVAWLSGLLEDERARRGTRAGTRALGTREQAVPALRWLFGDIRMCRLARDNAVGVFPAYAYRDEVIAVLATRRPSLRGALLAAKAAGHTHVILDGTLIHTDRIGTPGPTRGVDPWWSGKHRHHGGNVQVGSAPDGWPLWTSGVRPGREHDTTAARADPDLLEEIRASRPPSRRCAAGAAARGASATSPPPRWSCSTPSTTAPHDPLAHSHNVTGGYSERPIEPHRALRAEFRRERDRVSASAPGDSSGRVGRRRGVLRLRRHGQDPPVGQVRARPERRGPRWGPGRGEPVRREHRPGR